MRIAIVTVLAAAVLAPTAGSMTAPAPFIKLKSQSFGNILATRGHKALYTWNTEKADFKIHCTGACAQAWPPLLAASRTAVPRHVAGVTGTFGVIRRPDGRLQVTRNRLPVYSYANEGRDQVLCNNVDGWFVVRL
jgi:predicted lipoprotein with Yx(FWY)xxD motif